MATARDIVVGALRLLGVKPAESPISAAEIQDGLESLNDMMAEWEERSIFTGFSALGTADDPVEVPDSAIGAIKANLAIYIAPEYDKSVSVELAKRAKDGLTSVRASLIEVAASEYPDSLPVGSGNHENSYTTNGDVPGNVTDSRFYPENEKRNF